MLVSPVCLSRQLLPAPCQAHTTGFCFQPECQLPGLSAVLLVSQALLFHLLESAFACLPLIEHPGTLSFVYQTLIS